MSLVMGMRSLRLLGMTSAGSLLGAGLRLAFPAPELPPRSIAIIGSGAQSRRPGKPAVVRYRRSGKAYVIKGLRP